MKKCPFCAEEIQDEAVKCRFCGEFLDGRLQTVEVKKENIQWFFKPTSVVIAVLTVGPFALPLVWCHPKYSVAKKIIVSLVIIALTIVLSIATARAVQSIMQYYTAVLG